jgi:hypothetical protein
MVRLVESEGVGARLGPNHLDTPHSVRLEDFDQPRVPDRYIEMSTLWVEEDDIGSTGEVSPGQLEARPRIEHDKRGAVARTEQPVGGRIQVQPVWPDGGD